MQCEHPEPSVLFPLAFGPIANLGACHSRNFSSAFEQFNLSHFFAAMFCANPKKKERKKIPSCWQHKINHRYSWTPHKGTPRNSDSIFFVLSFRPSCLKTDLKANGERKRNKHGSASNLVRKLLPRTTGRMIDHRGRLEQLSLDYLDRG